MNTRKYSLLLIAGSLITTAAVAQNASAAIAPVKAGAATNVTATADAKKIDSSAAVQTNAQTAAVSKTTTSEPKTVVKSTTKSSTLAKKHVTTNKAEKEKSANVVKPVPTDSKAIQTTAKVSSKTNEAASKPMVKPLS